MIQGVYIFGIRCHDQDILNIVCKNKVTLLAATVECTDELAGNRTQPYGYFKMAPRQIYEEYVAARKCPYLIHFAGYQKPWVLWTVILPSIFGNMRNYHCIFRCFYERQKGV